MKKFLMIAAVAGVSLTSMAQLTTRESAPNTYKFGTRPQAGDLSLMFAVANLTNYDGSDSASNGVNGVSNVNGLKTGDLITAKYFKSDDVAFRAGIKLERNVSGKSSFDTDTSSELYSTSNLNQAFTAFGPGAAESSSKTVVRDWAIKVGIEKHFSNANFFDVYAGADLYLGFGKEKFEETQSAYGTRAVGGAFGNTDGFNTIESLTSARGYTKVGVLPFIGVQMFVLDLPVSVGIEYGWDALWKFGGLWKNDYSITQENGTTAAGFTTFAEESVSGTYYSDQQQTLGSTPTGTIGQNGSASSSALNTNQNVKLLVNVYFGRGGSSSSDVVIE